MIFMIHLQSAYGAVALISIGLGVHQLSISGGFMYSHVDVAGPKFSSIAFGVTNTAAQIPGFANPAIVAAVTKNVSNLKVSFSASPFAFQKQLTDQMCAPLSTESRRIR